MIVYDGQKKDFMGDVDNDAIANIIEQKILQKMGKHTPENEFRSWVNSLGYMYRVMNDPDIPDNAGVAIEYNIPQTSKRVDFIISGYDNMDDLLAAEDRSAEIRGIQDLNLIENDEDSDVMALRPMTCPFQYYVYKARQKSYRDLPYRMGETSTLFRNEQAGEMHGLTRVRQFTISEGHLVCTPEQVKDEFEGCVALAKYCLTTLGLQDDVTYRLSKWDPNHSEDYLGTSAEWDFAQGFIKEVLDDMGLEYFEAEGEAAFYGPKLDIEAKNVYGKQDTMITIQLDPFLADRYDMYFIDKDGQKKRPYIIHRTSIGCYERTLAWLIEKYSGNLPTWLCPEQVRILPISDNVTDYAEEVRKELRKNGVDVTVDDSGERIGYKIRKAQMEKVPYMLVIGAKEAEQGNVSVRSRYLGDEGVKPLADFISDICEEIRTKEIRKIEKKDE